MNERACEAIGIDLGTTYSSLAYMDPQLTPRVVCDSSGQSVMPSVVFFDDDEIIVGEMGLAQAKLHADRVVQFVKVYMGDGWSRELNGRVHTPESISALILGQLVREAEPQIGEIRRAVITVPAYFTEKRRRATQQAGEIAGLDVMGTLNEPMSAALSYGLHLVEKEQFAVVYDLGGGTFDVTVVRITPNELEELATNGNRQLGGRDWDQALIDFVCADFKKTHGVDIKEDRQAVQDLQIECEKAKRGLGRMAKTAIRLHAFGKDHKATVTREQFESLSAHLVQSTKLTTEIALEDAGLDWDQIAKVVLVGGSTHIPAVRRMLQEASGKTPDAGVNPVVAVALGAAMYAHMLETGKSMKTIHQRTDAVEVEPVEEVPGEIPAVVFDDKGPSVPRPPKLRGGAATAPSATAPSVRFVTAHGVGVKVHAEDGWRNSVLIPKNSSVPASVARTFLTKGKATGAGFITIEITQGDTRDLNLAEVLGTGRIAMSPGEEPGQPVEVKMQFDAQGRLHASARYVKTGQDIEITIDVKGGLKEEDVAAYREFMEETGFVKPFDAASAIAELDSQDDDDDDIDALPSIERV